MLLNLFTLIFFLSFGPPTYSKLNPISNRNGIPYSLKNSKFPNNEYSIYSLSTQNSKTDSEKEKLLAKEREQLYEAYNLLHTLAQDFDKPFDAPAVIVVGHQTSGKSALIEALMGFQFNQVGGGTKTRRPIALRMQYNPNYSTPRCYLTLENGKEEQRSLADIQAYIESENKRLERDATRAFDPREINIRMEYRYCPNMIVIDTPGMIHPPKGRKLTPQQRALAMASREAENLILSKISRQDYIILCVEDTTDWKHATTRNIVMQADPYLERTVLVTTKLDTKLPQFSEPQDLEEFLNAPLIQALFAQMLGGPFFTSVPSGRVHSKTNSLSHQSGGYENNEAFVEALKTAEKLDRSFIYHKIGRFKATKSLKNVGISRLRHFLEQRVEESYRRNVNKIIPLLTNDLASIDHKLELIEKELNSLSLERLQSNANIFREKFAKELSQIIQGTIRVSPEEWGETLENEQTNGGHFIKNQDLTLSSESYQQVLHVEIGNHLNKLFGGAQYHRALREFTIAIRHMKSPIITEDEISNAAGMCDTHNGINFMRAACIIAMEKAELSFEPLLESLKKRTSHIMKRIFPIIISLLKKSIYSNPAMMDINNQSFQEILKKIYEKFVEDTLDNCGRICYDDLLSMTRFVTWDVEDHSGSSKLYRLLPTPNRMAQIWKVALERKEKEKKYLGDDHDEDGDGGGVMEMSREEDEIGEDGEGKDEDARIEEEVLALANMKPAKDKKNQNKSSQKKKSGGGIIKNLFQKNKPLPRSSNGVKLSNKKMMKRNEFEDFFHSSSSGAKKIQSNDQQQYALSKVTDSAVDEDDAVLNDYYKMMQLTEEMLSGNSPSRTSALVTALVQFITSSWRNHFARSTAMKFNSYFLMPFVDRFPSYLRDELDKIYKDGIVEMFDIAETRRSLLAQRSELLTERDANMKLHQRFQQISSQLKMNQNNNNDGLGGGGGAAGQGINPQNDLDRDDEEEDDMGLMGEGGNGGGGETGSSDHHLSQQDYYHPSSSSSPPSNNNNGNDDGSNKPSK